MVVFPNVKINLGLNILRKRSDGYHDIETLMIGVDWCDVLEVVPSSTGETNLTVTGYIPDCPPEKNLVIKALNALAEAFGKPLPPVDIFLRKNIPDGAGLGGGSADAAFMLKALNNLFGLGFEDERLAEIASRIGSDCPFFIYNKPLLAEGRGEILTEPGFDLSELSRIKVVIVKPLDVVVSTKQAYSAVTPYIPENGLRSVLNLPLDRWKDSLINSFESSVFTITDKPEYIKRRLYEEGAVYASMSGSGSAVYGLFRSGGSDAERTAVEKKYFENLFPGCAVHVGRFII